MSSFMLPLLILSFYQEAHTASIYQETLPEDIKYNLIGYDNDVIEGMMPPLPQAPEHYSQGKSLREPNSPYVVEISRKYIKFKTTGFPSQKVRLTQNETEGIQKLSLGFVKLLNSSKLSSQDPETETETETDLTNLNPVISISHSGISLQFLNSPEEEDSGSEETENRDILWDFLTKYVRNVFEAKVKELKVGEKYADVIGTLTENAENFTAFENFEKALWMIMRLSVDYAETAFKGWESELETTTVPTTTEGDEDNGNDEMETFRATVATIFAYEEPSPFHVFPSQEFEHRRKDVDSIFYGRGII